MKTKTWLSIVFLVAALAALPLSAQGPFPTTNGNDGPVQSFGQFWILIDPEYQPLFNTPTCTAYNPATHVLQSPLLYDWNTTVMGHSKGMKENSPEDNGGVPVGLPPITVGDAGFHVPPSFSPILPNSHEVHTVIRHLNLTTYPAVPFAAQARVRAGECYNNTACSPVSPPPGNRISRGEVVSNASPVPPTPPPSPSDFPARSYFNVFAQIDIPAIPGCPSFPGPVTVYNQDPLLVATPSIGGFPPSGVVYMHDSSSAVAVKFLADGPKWKKGKRLGCIILAGHGIIPTFHRAAALENAPTVEPVAFQKEKEKAPAPIQGYGREERKLPPGLQKEEVDREAGRFQEHMKGEFQREGGRHKDCGPKGKED
ncbi:MAG TPA: hypothetical protein VJA94_11470 [Candidatus Angelobacter sp.]